MDDRSFYIMGIGAIIAIILAILAFGHISGFEFKGADDEAMEAVDGLVVDYEPWWDGILGGYELPDETESMLFALQSAIGAIIIGYFIGVLQTEKKFRSQSK